MNFTPAVPRDKEGKIFSELLILAEKVCIESAKLSTMHNEQVVYAVKELLRKVNSYYSNKIESEGTHPIDIERAMRDDFEEDEKRRDLQKLSLVYIDIQRHIEHLAIDKERNFFTKEFVKDVHRWFYSKEEMKNFLQIKRDVEGSSFVLMEAGEFRTQDVAIGKHKVPPAKRLESLFSEYEHFYRLYPYMTQATKLIYALSSHHRLTWLHPFLDGNGRTSRLVLDGILYHIGLEGYGLWNISRGLARDSKEYREYLAQADMVRQGDLDGRGVLSTKGLKRYVEFMLKTALDQIVFMNQNLKLDSLSSRIENFVTFSQKGMYPQQRPLPKHSEHLFKALLIEGEIPRGRVKEIIAKEAKTASTLIRTLVEMDYVESDSKKSPIRLKFNSFFASQIFPELIPLVK